MAVEKYWPRRLHAIRRGLKTASRIKVPLLIGLLAAVPQSYADTAAEKLQQALQAMNSYSALFSQRIYDESGEILQESSGFTQLQRPGKMYWESREPFRTVTISNEAILWHYDVDLEQVTRSALSEDLSAAPALILGGDAEALQQSFEVSSVEGQLKAFVLKSRSPDAPFSVLELHFDRDGVLTAMQFVDTLLQKTRITFTEVQLNQSVDESLFVFTVPEGADLISNDG